MDITISKKVLPFLYTLQDGSTVAEKVNISLVLGLFASKTITLEKAAELAGKNVWDFIEVLRKYQIPWGEYTQEDSEMDSLSIKKMEEGIYESNM